MSADAITADILGRSDPAVGNGLITWRYHELAVAMAERMGDLATWCAFGTWASRTAGASIRGEVLGALSERRITDAHPTIVAANARIPFVSLVDGSVIRDFLQDVNRRVSDLVWSGNRLVFAELGPAFTDFCSSFPAGVRPSPATVAAYLDRQRGEQRGTGLTSALGHYCQALTEPDRRRRVQLVCLANLEAVQYEQVRLHRFIEDALDAPFDELVADLRRLVTAGRPRWQRALLSPFLAGVLEPVVELFSPTVGELSTRHLMTIRIAGRPPLGLGADLPPVVEGGPFLPAELGVPRLEGLEAFLERLGRDGSGSGAADWSLLDDRMRFIGALFCSRLLLPDLLERPFSPAQVDALRRDELPPDLP